MGLNEYKSLTHSLSCREEGMVKYVFQQLTNNVYSNCEDESH